MFKKLRSKFKTKKKPKILELTQSGNDKAVVIGELADDEVAMMTGSMGGCVSAIVLWDRAASGDYRRMRGQHGSGGEGAIDWQRLLGGVPEDGSATIVVSMADSGSTYEQDRVKKKLADRNFAVEFVMSSNLLVYRDGTNEDLVRLRDDGLAYSERFEIRKEELPR